MAKGKKAELAGEVETCQGAAVRSPMPFIEIGDPIPDLALRLAGPPAGHIRLCLYVPLAAESNGYCPRHVELQLKGEEPAALRRMASALERSGAKLASGTKVNTPALALRWLLQEICLAGDAEAGGPNDRRAITISEESGAILAGDVGA